MAVTRALQRGRRWFVMPSIVSVGGARILDSHEAICNHCQCRGCQDQ
jgi:hypothetical protein